ncbi:hypothetical protein NL516_26165, partial [Klebsiella pneumoniae]|nr:hypothetical protein [Klebsiella pneumoniae]
WQSDVDAGVKGGLWFTKKSSFDPHPVFPRNIITLWGHSFLQNPRLANKLYKLTGMPVWNFGRSNITSKGAALRQGGQRIEVWPLTVATWLPARERRRASLGQASESCPPLQTKDTAPLVLYGIRDGA